MKGKPENLDTDYTQLEQMLTDALTGERREKEVLANRLDEMLERLVAANAYTWCMQDREDLVQEILIKLFKNDMKLLRCIHNPRAIPKWLSCLVIRDIISVSRKKSWKQDRDMDSLDVERDDAEFTFFRNLQWVLSGPDEQALANELENEWFPDAVSRLVTDPLDVAILNLTIEGAAPREIASVLDQPSNVISIRKTRIRTRLLEDLTIHHPEVAEKVRQNFQAGVRT